MKQEFEGIEAKATATTVDLSWKQFKIARPTKIPGKTRNMLVVAGKIRITGLRPSMPLFFYPYAVKNRVVFVGGPYCIGKPRIAWTFTSPVGPVEQNKLGRVSLTAGAFSISTTRGRVDESVVENLPDSL